VGQASGSDRSCQGKIDTNQKDKAMPEIPEMNCPECGSLMKYDGGPSDGNIFIMTCPTCGYQKKCYAEPAQQESKP